MGTELVKAERLLPSQDVERLWERAREITGSAFRTNTRYHYRADLRDFTRFCEAHGLQPMPATPETLALYIADRSQPGNDGRKPHKASTIRRRVAAISTLHKIAGHASPAAHEMITKALQGLVNILGNEARKKKAATADVLRLMLDSMPPGDGTPAGDLRAARDRAILLLGYAGGFRRSELSAVRVEDVSFEPSGLRVRLLGSKTDKAQRGRTVGISRWKGERCPVRAMRAWLDMAGIREGPIFRGILNSGKLRETPITGMSIATIWKKAAAAAGLNRDDFAGHSARRGHITEAYLRGVPETKIMRTTGHTSTDTLRSYEESANAYECSAAAVGL